MVTKSPCPPAISTDATSQTRLQFFCDGFRPLTLRPGSEIVPKSRIKQFIWFVIVAGAAGGGIWAYRTHESGQEKSAAKQPAAAAPQMVSEPTDEQIRLRAARAYSSYQRIGLRGANALFVTGW